MLVSFSLSRPHTSRLKAFRGGHRQDLFGYQWSFCFFENERRCSGKHQAEFESVDLNIYLLNEQERWPKFKTGKKDFVDDQLL